MTVAADFITRVITRQIEIMREQGRDADAEEATLFLHSGQFVDSLRTFEESTPETLEEFPGRRIAVELRQAVYAAAGWEG